MAILAKKIDLKDDIIHTILNAIRERSDKADELVESFYSENSKNLSYRHFTPFHVVKKAVSFLVRDDKDRILDIGSGNGKFCHIASCLSQAEFVGVEYRKDLVDEARDILSHLGSSNTTFHCANIVDIAFQSFSGVYLFNPFLEHIDPTARMDENSTLSWENYQRYVDHVKNQLAVMKKSSRLVTYYYKETLLPDEFVCKEMHFGGTLKFYEKER